MNCKTCGHDADKHSENRITNIGDLCYSSGCECEKFEGDNHSPVNRNSLDTGSEGSKSTKAVDSPETSGSFNLSDNEWEYKGSGLYHEKRVKEFISEDTKLIVKHWNDKSIEQLLEKRRKLAGDKLK